MAFVGIAKLQYGSRRGPLRRADGSYEYRETWVVRVDSSAYDGGTIEMAPGLPVYGLPYRGDAAAICRQRYPRQSADDQLVWLVEVVYEFKPRRRQERPDQPADVTETPPRRYWTSQVVQIFPLGDINNRRFRNSAGDPFEPPPAMYKYHRVLTIVEHLEDHKEKQAAEHLNTVNSDDLTIDGKTWAKHTGLLRRWDAEQDFLADGDVYWRRTIEIEFNPDRWIPWMEIDRGPRHKKAGKGDALFLARDDNGVLTGRDVLLNGRGMKIPEEMMFHYELGFILYREKSFRALKLPLK